MQETSVRFLRWEDPLEKGEAAHSSMLAWRIPWTVQSPESQSDFHSLVNIWPLGVITVLALKIYMCISYIKIIISLISLYDHSFLVYRNARNSVLISYSATLSGSLMSSSRFLVASLGFSMYSITSSANSDSFCFLVFFPTWIPFIYFSSLIVVARTSKTMLNKNHESDIFALFLILKQMLSAFHC